MQSYGGVSRYYSKLVCALVGLGQQAHIYAPFHRNKHIAGLPSGLVKGRYLKAFPPRTTRIFNAYNRIASRPDIYRFNPDIFHETYFSAQKAYSGKNPVVVTVYDMIHELYPDSFPSYDSTSKRKRMALERADHVISISENTKRDLMRLYDMDDKKISVVHLAADFPKLNETAQEERALDGPYILFVGERKGYKNFSGFVRAMARSKRLMQDFTIVAFGGGGFSPEETEEVLGLGFKDGQVVHMAGDDVLLSRLYKQARVFIYPSIYEGFGIPPLEAMLNDCVVICSNASSVPEVVGEAARLFDPSSLEDMCTSIEKTIYSETEMERLREKGKERARLFSWERCASETLKVYTDLLQRRR